jgi:hypothetical protein
MRYAKPPFAVSSAQARSRRIGRCVRCHAPVLADEEHYDAGTGVVHGACGADAAQAAGRPTVVPDPPTSSREVRRLEFGRPVRSRRVAPPSGPPSVTVTVLAGSGRRV